MGLLTPPGARTSPPRGSPGTHRGKGWRCRTGSGAGRAVARGRGGGARGSGSRSSCLPPGTACSRFYGAAGWADPRGPPASPPLLWSPALLPAHPRTYSSSLHTGANLFLSQTLSFPQSGGSELSRIVPTCREAGLPPSPNSLSQGCSPPWAVPQPGTAWTFWR